MGQLPGSGDISWLPAHSILKWIGGDISMLDPLAMKSSPNPEYLHINLCQLCPGRTETATSITSIDC